MLGDTAPPPAMFDWARERGVDLRAAGRAFRVEAGEANTWSFITPQRRLDGLPRPALPGDHQTGNAAAALAALDAVTGLPPLPSIVRALETVRLPGRFQTWAPDPRVVLDVAHNRQAVEALARTLHARAGGRRLIAVFGCMQDKDLGALAVLLPRVAAWYLTDLPTPRAARAMQLQAALAAQPHTVGTLSTWPTPAHALAAARAAAAPDDCIVVFGSFWTVGGVLAAGAEAVAPVHGERTAGIELA